MKRIFFLLLFILCRLLTAQTSSEVYQQANKLYSEGKIIEAIVKYTEAIKLDPKYVHSYNERGICLDQISRFDDALKDFNKAIEIKPTEEVLFHNRAITLTNLKKWNDALKDLDQAIKVNPDYIDALLVKATCYQALNQDEKAFAALEEAMKKNPDYAKTYEARGNYYVLHKKNDDALEDYNKSIKLDNTLGETYNSRGLIYYYQKDYDAAFEDFTNAVKYRPYIISHVKHLADAQIKLDKYSDAEKNYSKVIEMNPADTAAFYNRARAHYMLGNKNNAILDLKKILEMDWKNSNAAGLLMLIYYENDDFKNANYYFKLSKKIDLQIAKSTKDLESLGNEYDESIYKWMLSGKQSTLPELYDNYSWYDYPNISVSVSSLNGKLSPKSDDFPDLHYYAFKGSLADKSSSLTTLSSSSYSIFLNLSVPSEGIGISLGYENTKLQNNESQNTGTGNTIWKGTAGVENTFYWLKIMYEALALDMVIGKIGMNLSVQLGYSPEVKMFIRSERWNGSNLVSFYDETYSFNKSFAYIIGGELQYYLPFFPVSIGIGYNLGAKGPVETDNYTLTTRTASGTVTTEGSGSINKFGVGWFSGTFIFVNVSIPFK